MSLHNNWRKFLAEGKFVTADDKLLREVTEEEIESINNVIGELGPEDKAFNHIFKGKNRVLIPSLRKIMNLISVSLLSSLKMPSIK